MEKWKDIPGYEGLYQASDKGNIRSLPRNTTKGRILKQYVSPHNGYCYVSVCKENRSTTKRVHVLVAEAFFGMRTGKQQVNHIDGDKTNNATANLEYCTQQENMKHAYATGLETPKGIAVVDLDTGTVYKTASEAARAVSNGKAHGEMVTRVCRGKRSHYRNRRFAFYEDLVSDAVPKYKGKYKRKASESLWG